MHDDNSFQSEYEDRRARYHDRAERRAQRWAEWRQHREARRARCAERRASRYYGWQDAVGFWGPPRRGPSELTIRLREMMKQVDEIAARVGVIEKAAIRQDERLVRDIERLSRGASEMGPRT